MDNRSNNEKKSLNKRRRKRKRIDLLNILTIASFLVVSLLIYRYLDQKSKITELTVKSQELQSDRERLEEEIKTLNKLVDDANSLEYIEKIAREKLGMIKEGEKIYLDPEQIEDSETDEEIVETENE